MAALRIGLAPNFSEYPWRCTAVHIPGLLHLTIRTRPDSNSLLTGVAIGIGAQRVRRLQETSKYRQHQVDSIGAPIHGARLKRMVGLRSEELKETRFDRGRFMPEPTREVASRGFLFGSDLVRCRLCRFPARIASAL